MGKYTIRTGQNIYDAALHIYGGVEGIADLMINNPELSMAQDLIPGTELVYSDDLMLDAQVAAFFQSQGRFPAGGERNIYHKECAAPRFMELRVLKDVASAGFGICGEGIMYMDWGDNSPLEEIVLSGRTCTVTHNYNNEVTELRKVRFYGDVIIKDLDLTELHASEIILVRRLKAERVTLRDSCALLSFTALLDGIYDLDLRGLRTKGLLPLVAVKSLLRLDLRGADISRNTVDRYLIALAGKHAGRCGCTVKMDVLPGGEYREPERDSNNRHMIDTGMEAMWLLNHSWEEEGAWIFEIGDNTFSSDTI